MTKRQVTIKDIARELGISPSTVSKALKGHPDISATTKKAVKELVEKWNYKPDPIALSLQGSFRKTIGVIVPEIVHYFFSTVIGGIEDLAYDSGYLVMFCQSNESYEREVKAVATLLASRVDGILVSMCKTTKDFDHFRKIRENEIPLVFFDRICEEIDTSRVIVDDEEGAYNAVVHLIRTGCKNIIHLSGPENLLIGRNRRLGYMRALREHRMPILPENMIKCDTPGEAESVLPELLKRPVPPDGIFAVNDLTAAEAMRYVKCQGLKVPEDISFVGFTCGMISELTDPPLTSMEQHGYIIGREAVAMLITEIEKPASGVFLTKVIKTELVVKGSTRAI